MSPALRIESKLCCLALVALGVSAAGCGGGSGGPQRASVRGEVQLDDAPLKAGVIRFVPTDGTRGPVALATIKEGRFELSKYDGPVLGKHSIEIVPTLAENPIAGATDIKAAWTEYAKAKGAEAREAKQARKPNRNNNPELKVTVTAAGKNTFDFKLASN